MEIENVKFRQIEKLADKVAAVAEVKTAEGRWPYLVHLEQDAEGNVHVAKVLTNDADREIDWYDNDLHQAFVDVTAQMNLPQFAEQLANHEEVQARLNG